MKKRGSAWQDARVSLLGPQRLYRVDAQSTSNGCDHRACGHGRHDDHRAANGQRIGGRNTE